MGRRGDELIWPYGGASNAAEHFGAKINELDVQDVCTDAKNKIVTSPAFMFNGKFHEIQDGVTNMIKELMTMVQKK